MFESATIKLTAWYLALIMGISLAFSVVLYNSSVESLNVAYEHQRTTIRQQFLKSFGFAPSNKDVQDLQDGDLSAGQQKLLANLTLANLGVLLVGGAASYYMARRTLQPIEQTLEAQVRFTADASHELRTPLTAMQTEIEVTLRDKNLSADEARQMLVSNLEEVKKLQDLSNGLLALANQDKEHFEPHRVKTKTLVKAAISSSHKAAQQKQIEIIDDSKGMVVMGSQNNLMQLLSILLDNAIKYSPEKSTITITSQVKGGDALISVIDHGYGIQPSDMPHIFDRLYRAESSRNKQRVDGYGLGLSIAKKIVELHRGAIDVTSRVGHGSTFTVRLPLAAKKPAEKY